MTDRSRSRLGAGLLATALTLLALAVTAPVSGAQGGEPPLESNISVTQRPATPVGPCLGGAGALGHELIHTAETYTLRIVASSDLCEPIDAVAAIYSMPGNGIAWPQQLVELRNFTLSGAGETDVTFTKTCEPVQFDVLTGATPETVAPWGEWHGPLLIGDLNSAYQHWGFPCDEDVAGTTTTTTTTLPAAPASTTTSVPDDESTTTTSEPDEPEVLAGGEEPPPPPGGAPVQGTEVLGATQEAGPSNLALTGLSFRVLAIAALSLFLAGIAIAALGRRAA